VSLTEESIVATAAKKPVSPPLASSSKKTAVKVDAPAKPLSAPKAAVVKTKAVLAKSSPKVELQTREKRVAVNSMPAPEMTEIAASSRTRAKPVTPKPEPVAPSSVSEKPLKTMKTAETKTAAAKSSAKSAKASKKIVGIPQNDTELLAMPESDYMNEAQLAYFKAKLTMMRDEILENARETGEHLKENEVFADPNDRATVEEENLLEQRVRDRERKLLKKINSSLVRIESGEYGYCLETGDPIGLPRLLARPTAELSIEAQEKHERLEKLYAD
jgi:DnaK suppressor protein